MVLISKSAFAAFSCLSTAVLAQTPGSTQTITIDSDPSLVLAIIWGTKPVDSYNIYAGAAFYAQMDLSRIISGLENTTTPTDWCYPSVTIYGPGTQGSCAHLHIKSQSEMNTITPNQLGTVVSFIRGMGQDFATNPPSHKWNYEAIFNVVYNGKAIANGFVANQTDVNVPVGRPDIGPGGNVARSFVA